MVEHRSYEPKAMGSKPISRTTPMAQWITRSTSNRKIAGSSPAGVMRHISKQHAIDVIIIGAKINGSISKLYALIYTACLAQ